MTALVIVESPAKAKTINKYLGNQYTVIASYGHVRDLPTKNGSVNPDDNFKMVWELNDRGKKQLKEIQSLLKTHDTLLLATDPDREGEAISWHVVEELKTQKNFQQKTVRRVVFNEITKSAIQKAIDTPREIDAHLVSAYLARRALDYLMGFTLSPVLWRKLPGSRSAGRVQSVALRLISDREGEIEAFIPQEFWTIHGVFIEKKEIQASLVAFKGKKLEKLDIKTESEAHAILETLEGADYIVKDIQTKRVKRNPFPPFITSTLQQEASRKLGFSASKTMQLAQQLYEGVEIAGETQPLISYMRTDSTNLSNEALGAIRGYISKAFKPEYLPGSPIQYKTKSKNAQEAHEAIRPINPDLTPESLKARMSNDVWRLYDLIWKRAVASQMSVAEFDQTRIDIEDNQSIAVFRATGSVIKFDGYLALYNESLDDEAEEGSKLLPNVILNQALTCKEITSDQHFTAAPPRYTEASLIKKLEELGIGRPSTYANIIKVLQDRKYVRLDKKRFHCEDRGRIVTAFLHNFFKKYVEFDFTAQMEDRLDEIAIGHETWDALLKEFWNQLQENVKATSALRIAEVIEALNKDLENYLFPAVEGTQNRRACPECKDGELSLKLGKFGSFIGCSNYPECNYTRKLSVSDDGAEGEAEEAQQKNEAFEPRVLGQHPELNVGIALKKGPYGFYVEVTPDQAEAVTAKGKKTKPKPKRAAVPKDVDPASLTLELAVRLLSLPRELGNHPETKLPIIVNKGRFGPYIQHNDAYTTLPAEFSPYTVSLNEAVEVLAKPKVKKTKKQ